VYDERKANGGGHSAEGIQASGEWKRPREGKSSRGKKAGGRRGDGGGVRRKANRLW
jgi:hypothetical protein